MIFSAPVEDHKRNSDLNRAFSLWRPTEENESLCRQGKEDGHLRARLNSVPPDTEMFFQHETRPVEVLQMATVRSLIDVLRDMSLQCGRCAEPHNGKRLVSKTDQTYAGAELQRPPYLVGMQERVAELTEDPSNEIKKKKS